jgi:hypothetical protein
MFNKKALLILLVVVVFMFMATTSFGQEIISTGTAEFGIGVEFGLILNQDQDLPALGGTFNWGTHSSFDGNLNLGFTFYAYSGDSEGNGAITAGFDFLIDTINDKHVGFAGTAYAEFKDILGKNNDIYFYYEDDREHGIDPYLSLRAFFGIGEEGGLMKLFVGFVDYMNDGVSNDIDSLEEIIVDPADGEDFATSKVEGGFLDLDIAGILDIDFIIFYKFKNVMSQEADTSFYDEYDENPRASEYKFLFGFDFGLASSFKDFGSLSFDYKFELNNVMLLTNTIGFEFNMKPKAMDGFELTLKVDAEFNKGLGREDNDQGIGPITYDDDGNEEIIEILETDIYFVKFPIQLDFEYAINLPVIITPILSFYMDFANMINTSTDPDLGLDLDNSALEFPFFVKLGVKLGFGGGGLLTLPIYAKLTNIPFSTDYDIDWDDEPPVQDQYLRMLIGIGLELEF